MGLDARYRFAPNTGMFRRILLASLFVAAAFPARAQISRTTEDFVAANLIAIFYHELAHALIDQLNIPIYAQEEDAADVMSVVMVHRQFEEKDAERIARAAAFGYRGSAQIGAATGSDVAWWDVHGADLQRYYNITCLFYGADPGKRGDFAREMELPDARAKTCREEFQQANDAWGPVITRLEEAGGGHSLWYSDEARSDPLSRLVDEVISLEVRAFNNRMSLPRVMPVRIGPCGFINAFYDPNIPEIIFCTEFAEYLAQFAR